MHAMYNGIRYLNRLKIFGEIFGCSCSFYFKFKFTLLITALSHLLFVMYTKQEYFPRLRSKQNICYIHEPTYMYTSPSIILTPVSQCIIPSSLHCTCFTRKVMQLTPIRLRIVSLSVLLTNWRHLLTNNNIIVTIYHHWC